MTEQVLGNKNQKNKILNTLHIAVYSERSWKDCLTFALSCRLHNILHRRNNYIPAAKNRLKPEETNKDAATVVTLLVTHSPGAQNSIPLHYFSASARESFAGA